MKRIIGMGWIIGMFLIVYSSPAQDVAPRVNVAGRGIVSFDASSLKSPDGDYQSDSKIDYSDSALLARVDTQLYSGHRAGVVFGLTFTDPDSTLDDVFYHQVNVFYQTQYLDVRLGRSRLRSQLIEFPTLRDDDLVEYTFVNNAFSNSDAAELQQYGNVAYLDVYQFNSRLQIGLQAENRLETDVSGEIVNDFKINTAGLSLIYRLPDSIRFQEWIQEAGLVGTFQRVNLENKEWIAAVMAGLALNLDRNPLDHFEFRAQTIWNSGVDEAGVDTIQARAQAEYYSAVGSIRFLHNPELVPRLQAALTGAYKQFPDDDTWQMSIIPSLVYCLGANFDVGLQYKFTDRGDILAAAEGAKEEHVVMLAGIFNFNIFYNDYFEDRDSILSMEHGYIP